MSGNKHLKLNIPQGTEVFYLDEAFRHRRIREHIETIFTSWGYLPIQTPVFDYFDTYRNLLSSKEINKIYRLFDRDGDILMLRTDITLFLAKQLGFLYKKKEPLRVCYSDSILRHQDKEDISSNEFYQVGAELLGSKGIKGDLEVITLLARVLCSLNLKNPVIHIGSRELLEPWLKKLTDKDKASFLMLISTRAFDEAEELLSLNKVADSSAIIEFLSFIGSAEELTKGWSKLPEHLKNKTKDSVDYLLSVLKILDSLESPNLFTIDLSEVGEKPYYTGLVFKAYIEGVASEIASGGRYDKLLGYFGSDAPSAGFTILLRKIEPLLRLEPQFCPPENILQAKGDEFIDKYQNAEKLRKEGKTVIL